MLVAIYVDDIDVAYNCQGMFRTFRDKLTTKFNWKDLGELLKVLYIGFLWTTDEGLFLSQES